MKFSRIIFRSVYLFFLLQLAIAGQAFAYERVNWKDESMIHDGRLLDVERQASNSLNFELYWLLPPIFRFQPSNFDEHRIEFRHPDTKERVIWSGERHFTPVRIDIIDGTPYLVIYGRPDKKTEKIYGCPELPYIYLKYQRNLLLSKWITISVEEAPKQLLKGNLSVYDFRSKNGRAFKWKDVERDVKFFEGQSYGQMQETIPRSYDEWHTKFKNSALNERMPGDCRPPRAPLPEAVLPTAIEGKPELLETTNYTPDRIAIGEEWTDFVFDSKREGACKNLFRPTDPNDSMQGQRFVKDSSGKKPAPYSRAAQFNMGVRVLCDDDDVWFITHQEVPGNIVISKFSVTGDLVFRTSFRNPDGVEGFVGYIRIPSLRSEGGYLYFDWLDFRDINQKWHIKRWLKMRIKEPDKPNAPVNKDAAR